MRLSICISMSIDILYIIQTKKRTKFLVNIWDVPIIAYGVNWFVVNIGAQLKTSVNIFKNTIVYRWKHWRDLVVFVGGIETFTPPFQH